ncbi:hypothetical protein HDV03_002238 [Kappamyces sp. JEL0829]|nr:hypothetical protein HDV03_002238 [Kappamyces sp. JEL0829]
MSTPASVPSSRETLVEEELDESNRSIIMGLIGQLREGTELSKVTLPTFVLEPRSMCERLALDIQDPAERMLQFVRWVMSGHHTRPKGVKKPFNPILGEFYRCEWAERDGSEAFYICEQVSHHPPHSAFFYCNPAKSIWISGDLKPKAKFLGNSAGTNMEGGSLISLAGIDEYELSNPNVYARSILIGKMFMELGDSCVITSLKSSISCSLDFKQRGMFGGSNDTHCVSGKIFNRDTDECLYKISGKWAGTTIALCKKDGKESVVFDGPRDSPKERIVLPLEEQEEFESKRLWHKVEAAVRQGDHKTATAEKLKIEDNQRSLVKKREASGEPWQCRFFTKVADAWEPVIMERIRQDRAQNIATSSQVIRDFVYSKPAIDLHKAFWIKNE